LTDLLQRSEDGTPNKGKLAKKKLHQKRGIEEQRCWRRTCCEKGGIAKTKWKSYNLPRSSCMGEPRSKIYLTNEPRNRQSEGERKEQHGSFLGCSNRWGGKEGRPKNEF